MTPFTKALWSANKALYERTLAMPFNEELQRGVLGVAPFRHYIIQDAHYLEGFARALALAAAKADGPEQVAMLASSAAGAIHVERGLHETYFRMFGVTPAEFAATRPTPVCDHYVSFLMKCSAIESFPVAVAALLPCFWIYMQVGKAIHARSKPGNPYQAWIDTYAGEEFEAAVRRMMKLTDDLAADASEATKERMSDAYAKSALLEWMFWDSAYRQAAWPQPTAA